MLQGKTPRQIEVAEGNLRRGFLTSGLWAWSRHPNFLCEQLNFWILSLFTVRATVPQVVFEKLWSSLRASIDLRTPLYIVESVKAASPHIFNYSWIAGISMTALFYASTALTEEISSGKYPKYAEYQKRVGMFQYDIHSFPPRMLADCRSQLSHDNCERNLAWSDRPAKPGERAGLWVEQAKEAVNGLERQCLANIVYTSTRCIALLSLTCEA